MDIFEYENQIRAQGFELICGIDEAGRGPLAGPVFAAAAVLPQGLVLEGLGDSKKISEKKREILFEQITEKCTYFIASASEEEIDEINILQATFLAMRRAYEGLCKELRTAPNITLIDGNQVPLGIPDARCIIGGDAICASISAASILAKVSRDRYMRRLAEQYPQYAFEKHKGYGTKLHYELIKEHGISPVHRRSFLKKLVK